MNSSADSPPSRPQATCVELAVIADRDFFIPTLVMLSSARQSKAAGSCYRIHFFSTSGFSDWQRDKLSQLSAADVEILLHTTALTEEERSWDHRRCVQRISGATMVRLRLPELLPDVERLLYLDGDIIVRKDLTPLFQEDCGGALLAGVTEMAGMLSCKTHEKLGTSHYINAGVLLMNLAELRRQSPFRPEALKAAMHNPNVVWMDQDIINLYCDHALHLLPLRCNAMLSSLREIHHYSLASVNEFYGTQYPSWEAMEEDALLIHVAGHKKPWLFSNVLHSELWMEAYRQSPLAHLSLPRGTEPEELRATLHSLYGIFPEESQDVHWRLFGVLPLLTVKRRRGKCRYLLLGLLPLLKVSEKAGNRRYLLFGFLPLLSARISLRP